MRSDKKDEDAWEKANNSLEQSEKIVGRITGLVSALIILSTETAVLAGVIMGIYQPPAGAPKECKSEIASVIDLPLLEATDEIFWDRHSELKRRKIRSYEGRFSAEWWEIQESIKSCQSKLGKK